MELCKGPYYIIRALFARVLDLDRGENDTGFAARALLLGQLAWWAELLEDHIRVAASVGVGVVEAHYEIAVCSVRELC